MLKYKPDFNEDYTTDFKPSWKTANGFTKDEWIELMTELESAFPPEGEKGKEEEGEKNIQVVLSEDSVIQAWIKVGEAYIYIL
jgi:hypothetical protein